MGESGTVRSGNLNLQEVTKQVEAALCDLLQCANLKPGQILVVGGSTSEVLGRPIGSATSLEVAHADVQISFQFLRYLGADGMAAR